MCLSIIFYEQQVKRELKRIHISGYRCNERLTVKTDGSKILGYTRLHLVTLNNFYYEQQVKRVVKRKHVCGYRCNERLKVKTDGTK